jgi:hypothetical protein
VDERVVVVFCLCLKVVRRQGKDLLLKIGSQS